VTRAFRIAGWIVSVALCAGPAAAQQAAPPSHAPGASEDDELAQRTLANAEQLLKEGKVEQALRDLDQIPKSWPRSAVADDALFRLGSWYYPASSIEDLGRAGADAIARARDLFTQVQKSYPREDSAPRALVKLGLIALEAANPNRSVDEAYASFSSVVNIYPSSDAVEPALYGAGYADFEAGRFDKAIQSFERVAERFPRGALAAGGYLAWLGYRIRQAGQFPLPDQVVIRDTPVRQGRAAAHLSWLAWACAVALWAGGIAIPVLIARLLRSLAG